MRAMSALLDAVHRNRQAIFALFAIAIVLWLLWVARGALPAFFVGLALAFVLDPAVTFVARRGIPRWAGVIITYAAAIAVLWAIVAFVLPPITAQAREFVDHLPEWGASIGDVERALLDWYEGLPLPPEIREAIDEQIAASGQLFSDLLRAILAPTVGAIVRTATFLLGLVVVPVWLFYVLKDRERFTHSVAGAMPPSWRADTENILGLLGRVGGRWVRGQLLLGVSIFLATAIGLTILTFLGFERVRTVHARAGAHRGRARVAAHHRPHHRRHSRHPRRPHDRIPRGHRRRRAVHRRSSSSRTTSSCRR